MYKKIFILLLFLSTTVWARTMITVTHPVQEYFVNKIANNKVYVRIVYDSIHDFTFDNKSLIRKLANTEYYFTFGLEEENKLIKTFEKRNSDLRVFNMLEGIPYIKGKNNEIVPYIWMDPILVRKMAMNIFDKLVEMRSYDKEFFEKNLEAFLNELDEIYMHVKKRIDEKELYGFFAFSHQLDYFAKRYRLNVYHREFRYTNANEVPDLIKLSRKEHIKHIVLHDSKSFLIAQSLASHIGAKIVELDLYDRNWKSNIYKVVRGLSNP